MTTNSDNKVPVIRLNALTKTFKNLRAVNELTIDIYPNEILGLLGPNGAGKTTTIKLICGLLLPTSGEVLLHGQPWNKASHFRKKIGYAPQENIFWPKLTCLEQLVFTGRMYDLSAKQSMSHSKNILEKLGLQDKMKASAYTLSGGMKRRLNLALALVHDPEIVILDEPEAGLDPQSRLLVREFIRGLAEGKTIILSTHNMDEADRLSNRIAIMDYGELLLTGSPEYLKNSVGKGDIIEIETENTPDVVVSELKLEIESIGLILRLNEGTFLIQGMNLVGKTPDIIKILMQKEIRILKMTLRENSLEDVFIHLTGRRLRA